MSRFSRHLGTGALAVTLLAGTAAAQLLPGVGLPSIPAAGPVANLPVAGPVLQDILAQPQAQQALAPTLDSVAGLPDSIAQSGAPNLLELRKMRLNRLIRDNRQFLEADDKGDPVRRGVLVAANPDPVSLQLASAAGFRVMRRDSEPELGLSTAELSVPNGLPATKALRLLHKVAPSLNADYDPVYQPAGGGLRPIAAPLASSVTATSGAFGRTIGMVDGGVASHPSLAGAHIEQNGFAGAPKPTGHGTAVASLLVGEQGPFRGAATGAQLYVADVYGGSQAAGSATAIVRALGWLAAHHAQVITISLVGPANALVQRAMQAVQARGIQVVAAVGNDGPAAPPQYPASYPGVIAVTGVDAHGRALLEAGRASHLDFAAPGADMAAALPGHGFARVRGTSFAAPLAAARLLVDGSVARLASEARPGKGRIGRGIVCDQCRVDPRIVGAR
jgi:hypothetical protein